LLAAISLLASLLRTPGASASTATSAALIVHLSSTSPLIVVSAISSSTPIPTIARTGVLPIFVGSGSGCGFGLVFAILFEDDVVI
jgi:hypothetical protein